MEKDKKDFYYGQTPFFGKTQYMLFSFLWKKKLKRIAL